MVSDTQVRRRPGRPKGVSTDNQQAKRARILAEAAALFAEQGFAAASMDELAERLELNKATLYYYYRSKGELLFELALRANTEALAIAEESAKLDGAAAQLAAFIDAMTAWVYDNRLTAQIFIMEQNFFVRVLKPEMFEALSTLHRTYMRRLYGILSEGMDTGEFVRMDIVTAGRSISTMLFNIATWRATSLGAEAVAEQMKLLFLEGLRAD